MMDLRNLLIGGIYLAVLSLLVFLVLRFREKFWKWFVPVIFPILLTALFIYNLVSFTSLNQPYFNWAYQGVLRRLSSNELIDLYSTSATPLKPEWIYPFIEDYYLGRTLFIPENLMDSLDLSLERLVSQGRLAAVKIIMIDGRLAESDLEGILSLEMIDIHTNELNKNGNITREEGDIYHFVTAESDPGTPLLLIRFENQLFFIPEDLLLDLGGGL